MQGTLFELEKFENTMEKISFHNIRNLTVRFMGQGLGEMYIYENGKPHSCLKLNTPVIHQLGYLVFPNVDASTPIFEHWHHAMMKDPENFCKQVADALAGSDMQFSVYNTKGLNNIYGIFPKDTLSTSQLRFRNQLITELLKNGISLHNTTVRKEPSGLITETFESGLRSKRVNFNFFTTYPRNNGTDEVEFGWRRFILVCANGLRTAVDDPMIKWNPREKTPIRDYVQSAISSGLRQREQTEEKISRALATRLDTSLLEEFRYRIHLSPVSKELIDHRLRIERKETGNTEWSLSQALTWLGTHETDFAETPRLYLEEAGTNILDMSLESYLDKEIPIEEYERYGAMWPRGFPF